MAYIKFFEFSIFTSLVFKLSGGVLLPGTFMSALQLYVSISVSLSWLQLRFTHTWCCHGVNPCRSLPSAMANDKNLTKFQFCKKSFILNFLFFWGGDVLSYRHYLVG